jgi:hypothetical protein
MVFYAITMRHIEMHLIETAHDVDAANAAGLDIFDDESCEQCHEQVGSTDAGFVAFVVCLDDEAEWIICAECANPVL